MMLAFCLCNVTMHVGAASNLQNYTLPVRTVEFVTTGVHVRMICSIEGRSFNSHNYVSRVPWMDKHFGGRWKLDLSTQFWHPPLKP